MAFDSGTRTLSNDTTMRLLIPDAPANFFRLYIDGDTAFQIAQGRQAASFLRSLRSALASLSVETPADVAYTVVENFHSDGNVVIGIDLISDGSSAPIFRVRVNSAAQCDMDDVQAMALVSIAAEAGL